MLKHEPVTHPWDRRIQISQAKQAFLERLTLGIDGARSNPERAQAHYKRKFNARIRQRLASLKPGDYVYREILEHPQGVSPKLASPVDGPYRVLGTDWPTIAGASSPR